MAKILRIEKSPFLTLGVSPLIAAFRYYEDLRKAAPPNGDFHHAFTFFLIFLVIGIFSIGLYTASLFPNVTLPAIWRKPKPPKAPKPMHPADLHLIIR
jgi:hypothetical protein